MVTGVLANVAVSDLERAEQWYGHLLERAPDQRPMPGLLQWDLGDGFGVQLWKDADRAGGTTFLLLESALDVAHARLEAAGLADAGPQPGGGSRVLQVTDPDGNTVVLVGD